MSRDVEVSFKENKPTRALIQQILEDYLDCRTDQPRPTDVAEINGETWGWYVKLRGTVSDPFRRIDPQGYMHLRGIIVNFEGRERLIEVFLTSDGFMVTTREVDDFTNVVADGFVKLCAHYFHGDVTA